MNPDQIQRRKIIVIYEKLFIRKILNNQYSDFVFFNVFHW